MNIYTIMWNDNHFMNQSMSMNIKYSQYTTIRMGVTMKQLFLWRSSIIPSNDKQQFDLTFPLEKFYEEFLRNKHKHDALIFFKNELEHVINLKSTTNNPIVLKMLEDQIAMYSETLVSLKKPANDPSNSMNTGTTPFRFCDELEKLSDTVIQAKVSESNIEDIKGLPDLKDSSNNLVASLISMHSSIYAMQTGNTKNPNHNAKWQSVLISLDQLIEELKHVNDNA